MLCFGEDSRDLCRLPEEISAGESSRRLACIDVTPDLARDVSTLKQDLFDIKKDVKDIKIVLKDIKDRLAAKPWYRF